MHPITLDWSLERKGNALRVTYSIKNTSTQDVVLLDRLYMPTAKGKEPAFDRAIVRGGDTADDVLFVRGYVPPAPGRSAGGIEPPLARKLAPNATITGEASVPLPVTAWHNYLRTESLKGTPKQAALEVGYLVDHKTWVEITLTDGSKHQAPGHPFVAEQKLIRGAAKPLP